MPRILLRADGSESIGLGHLVRSMVLARALSDLGALVQVWGHSAERARSLLKSTPPVVVRELPEATGGSAQVVEIVQFQPDLVLVDGYHFQPDFFAALDAARISYGVIDDNGETNALNPRVLINYSLGADGLGYRERFPDSLALLGSSYFILRDELRHLIGSSEKQEASVVVSLGGSARVQLLRTVLLSIPEKFSQVVCAPGTSRELESLKEITASEPYSCKAVSPADFITALSKSKYAIVAGGNSLWEALVLKNSVFAMVIAENQLPPVLAAFEAGYLAGWCDMRHPGSAIGLKSQLTASFNEDRLRATPQIPMDGAQQIASEIVAGSFLDNSD